MTPFHYGLWFYPQIKKQKVFAEKYPIDPDAETWYVSFNDRGLGQFNVQEKAKDIRANRVGQANRSHLQWEAAIYIYEIYPEGPEIIVGSSRSNAIERAVDFVKDTLKIK